MSKNKCSNCGTTKTDTFWTFEDKTMLCDKCHKHHGKKWQKEVDKNKGVKTYSLAIISMIVSILGFLILFFNYPYISIIFGISSLVCGIVGFIKIKDNHLLRGKGLARVGIILGAITILLGLLIISQNNVSQQTDNTNTVPTTQNTPSQDTTPQTTQPQEYCGDGYCNNGETCSTCSSDCGKCAYCGDGTCNNDETCSSCPKDCGQCIQKQNTDYSFTSSNNEEPYYSTFCDKINPYDLSVREAEAKAIRNDPGSYSVAQLFDIYDWVKDNIIYQNVPLGGIPYPAKDTLATGSGDCKNQAVLIASMIGAINGDAKVVVDPSCEHAYTIVRFGDAGTDISWFTDAVAKHYGANVQISSFENEKGIWVIFDPAGGRYPGNTLPECTGNRKVYFVDSCRSCANQYPNAQYSYQDKCYSECPSGTIHINDYACFPCPTGSGSYNNQCVTCSTGLILGTDGKCHQHCGDSTHYCTTGTCFNGNCVSCQAGYSLHTDGKCYPN